MHIGKISAIVAQVSLTSASVLAGDNMGKRDSWEDAKASALSKASQAAAKFNQRNAAPEAMITPAPEKRQFFGGNRQNNGLEAGRQQGLAAAEAAQERAGKIAADFNSRFPPFGFRNNNNDKRDLNNMEQGQQYNDNPNPGNQWADNNGAYQSYYSGAAAQGQAYASAAADANGAYNNANQAQEGWQADAAAGQQAASDWQAYGSAQGASWAAYGASVAASAQGQASEAVASAQGVAATAAAGNDGNWQGDVASAQSLASSYRSEYGVANPTGVQPTPSAPHGTQMVQVNEGSSSGAGSLAGKAVGVAAAMAGFVFGML
ncbi:hypothetical protein QBC41DRAFT_298851 [Cercophora samala]|uniref:Uncharacterized protein n=1 Tax=Cercophora samala TaxID=330535 RepID=A0AA39ZLL5_9PEZI|nr:hypothetical protein QBC41DRAFT_298851 [Cercophora samala]